MRALFRQLSQGDVEAYQIVADMLRYGDAFTTFPIGGLLASMVATPPVCPLGSYILRQVYHHPQFSKRLADEADDWYLNTFISSLVSTCIEFGCLDVLSEWVNSTKQTRQLRHLAHVIDEVMYHRFSTNKPCEAATAEWLLDRGSSIEIVYPCRFLDITENWLPIIEHALESGKLRQPRAQLWWGRNMFENQVTEQTTTDMLVGRYLQLDRPSLCLQYDYSGAELLFFIGRRRYAAISSIQSALGRAQTDLTTAFQLWRQDVEPDHHTPSDILSHGFDALSDTTARMGSYLRDDMHCIYRVQWHNFGRTIMALEQGALACGHSLPLDVHLWIFDLLAPVAHLAFTRPQLIECIRRYRLSAANATARWRAQAKRSIGDEVPVGKRGRYHEQ